MTSALLLLVLHAGDLVRTLPNPYNTTSGGNIQPARNGTNNNNVLITSTRVLKNGTTETITAYESSACVSGKFDMDAYLPGTKSKLQTAQVGAAMRYNIIRTNTFG